MDHVAEHTFYGYRFRLYREQTEEGRDILRWESVGEVPAEVANAFEFSMEQIVESLRRQVEEWSQLTRDGLIKRHGLRLPGGMRGDFSR